LLTCIQSKGVHVGKKKAKNKATTINEERQEQNGPHFAVLTHT